MKHSSETNEEVPSASSAQNSNDDKLKDQNEMVITVETRLNQIREYIKTTLLMMDSLKKSSDPRAKTQHEKLGRMVEDLHDSEIKLSKLLQQYRVQGSEINNVDKEDIDKVVQLDRNTHLYKKMEESQKKLTQLQEHQTQLLEMQKSMTESLNEARQLRNNLRLLEPKETDVDSSAETEAQMVALVGKLSQLQVKKQNMDQLIAELNATNLSENYVSKNKSIQEKEMELEELKNQLAHLKVLVNNAVKNKASNESQEQCEIEEEQINTEQATDSENKDESFMSSIKPKIEEIQNVTKELKEQAALLQAARAEVAALKQSYILRNTQNPATNASSNSNPVPCQNNDFIQDKQLSSNE